MEQNRNDKPDDTPASREELAPASGYEKPTLTSYGSLTRLTRNLAGTTSDAKGGKRRT